jgi:hypothetical protein
VYSVGFYCVVIGLVMYFAVFSLVIAFMSWASSLFRAFSVLIVAV